MDVSITYSVEELSPWTVFQEYKLPVALKPGPVASKREKIDEYISSEREGRKQRGKSFPNAGIRNRSW